jgi:hypothetical protein
MDKKSLVARASLDWVDNKRRLEMMSFVVFFLISRLPQRFLFCWPLLFVWIHVFHMPRECTNSWFSGPAGQHHRSLNVDQIREVFHVLQKKAAQD